MKIFLIIAVSLFSMMSFAQTAGKPFQLPEGKYSGECWSINLSKNSDSKMIRDETYYQEIIQVTSQENNITETCHSISDKMVVESVTNKQTVDLGNGDFKLKSYSQGSYKISTSKTEPQSKSLDDSLEKYQSHYETTLKVTEQNTKVLSVKIESGANKANLEELSWKKMDDGRVVVQSYLREKFIERTADGKYRERLVSNSTCIYKSL